MHDWRSFGLAAGLLASVGTADAAGIQCLVPIRPPDGNATGLIYEIDDAGDDAWLIGARNGRYRLDAAGLTALSLTDGGATGDIGKALGLDNRWAYNIVKHVGNYGESFVRNLAPLGFEQLRVQCGNARDALGLGERYASGDAGDGHLFDHARL